MGERVQFGEAQYLVRGLIEDEPDRISEGFTLGPVAIVSIEGFERSRLIQPGSLYQSKYRVRTAATAEPPSASAQDKGRKPRRARAS